MLVLQGVWGAGSVDGWVAANANTQAVALGVAALSGHDAHPACPAGNQLRSRSGSSIHMA